MKGISIGNEEKFLVSSLEMLIPLIDCKLKKKNVTA